MKQQTTNIS